MNNDFSKCLICQDDKLKDVLVLEPQEKSFKSY